MASLKHQDILQILLQFRTGLMRSGLIITRDFHASEDIYQNLVLKSLRAGTEFENSFALLAWCKVVIRSEALSWLNRQGRELALEDAQILDLLDAEYCDEFEQYAKHHAWMETLDECLKKLSADSQRLINLRYDGNRQCDEVARMMGASIDTIYKRLSRIHMMLRDCVDSKINPSPTTGDYGHGI